MNSKKVQSDYLAIFNKQVNLIIVKRKEKMYNILLKFTKNSKILYLDFFRNSY
jgi:hypothetical protein